MFRSAVVVALPIASEGINEIHLNESQAAWSINKIMGLDYTRDDDQEVISKIMIMDAKDE